MAESEDWAEQRQLKAEAREGRHTFRQGPEQGLAQTLRATMTEYHHMRGQGVSQEDACRGLEAILRDVFPVTHFPPHCAVCADTGWEEQTCSFPRRCGRRRCSEAEDAFEHGYVEPCICPSGDKFRQRLMAVADAEVAAGKTKRRTRSFSRLSR